MAKTNPAEFVRQVDQERKKVTWTQKNETIVTTIMVFIMVALASVFFLLIDQVIGLVIDSVIG